MRLGRKREQPAVRTPNINRPQQPIFQYSSNRSQDDRRRRENFEEIADQAIGRSASRKFGITLTALVLIMATILASLLTAEPKIVIEDGGQPVREASAYRETAVQAARRNLRGYSKLTLDRQSIASSLRTKYPEITDVSVGTPLIGRRAVIHIKQAQPAVLLRSDGNRYILDTSGIAIRKANGNLSSKGLVEINDETETGIRLGYPALTSGQIAFVMEVRRQAENRKLPLTSAIMTRGGGELDVKHGNLKYIVKYNLYEDARKSFGAFVATKEFLEEAKRPPVEYIDVRIPERSYVK